MTTIKKIFYFMFCSVTLSSFGNSITSLETIQPNRIEMRLSRHAHLSKILENLSDEEISILLKNGIFQHSGWGKSVKLEIDEIPIFVKKLPLNDLEGMDVNLHSTKNLFELPLYYQYGVGSGGFNLWREVHAHIMTTKWVLNNETQNIPLMYHWRIIHETDEKDPFDEEKWNDYVKYWGNSSAIGERVKANYNASSYVALFIEYFPENINNWLIKQKESSNFDQSIEMVEHNLKETIAFLNSKGMLHFDAHFRNILTDGERIYLSDFGLATSSQFDLSEEELQFFYHHENYDRCYIVTTLTHWLLKNLFPKESYDQILSDFALGITPQNLPENVSPYIYSIIKRNAPLTQKMGHFFKILREENKESVYPQDDLDRLLFESLVFHF